MDNKQRTNGLKHRLTQLLLRSACSTTTATTSSAASFKKLAKNNQPEPNPNPSPIPIPKPIRKLDRFLSFPSHSDRPQAAAAPLVQISIDCAGRRSVDAATPSFKKKKERRLTETGFLYETGEGEGRKCPPASPSSPPHNLHKFSKPKRKESKKLVSNSYGFSSSSSPASKDELGFFTSDREDQEEEDEQEETKTLFSSRSFSFSSDSSEFYRRNKRSSRYSKCNRKRCEIIKKEMKAESNNGFAVVKKTTDPYKEFRNSMVEMILEKRINGSKDMQRLLGSYLELNSSEHHPIIVAAFADVWDAIFPKS